MYEYSGRLKYNVLKKSFKVAQRKGSNITLCFAMSYTYTCTLYRARILKYLLEAGKSTFRNELSFQRSESTTGFDRLQFWLNDKKIVLYQF